MSNTTNTTNTTNTSNIQIAKPIRGRKPKNTTENTKRKITETRAKTFEESEDATLDTETPEIKLQTFHYNFSEEITERFMYFATLHRYDDRKVFKEAWKKWIQEEDVAAAIAKETLTLETNNYEGDILDKMFKSVRYYYRKKPVIPKAAKTRKQYVALSFSVLDDMDKHVIETIIQHTNPETNECSISPAKAFELYKAKLLTVVDDAKYKKTYKNRFFIASRNIRKL
jgi:hypothetical protein